MIDVSTLEKANHHFLQEEGGVLDIWTAEAHGVRIKHVSLDPDAEFWVSPIWNMRQKGVSLVDSSGQMVKNERVDR